MSDFLNNPVNQRFKQVYKNLTDNRYIFGKSDIAEKLGTYNHVINSILKGKRSLTVDQISKLFHVYGVNANFLFKGEEPIFLIRENINEQKVDFDNNESDFEEDLTAYNTLLGLIKNVKNNNEQELLIDDNFQEITELPDEIWELKHLKALVIDSTSIKCISPKICNLNELEVLSLNNNNLTIIPPELGKLTQLKRLDLDFNQIKTLPNELQNLVNLTHLAVRYNELEVFPNVITALKNLECLHLEGNKLKNLPNEISNLSDLIILDLDENELEKFPIALTKLTQLTSLDISNNDICLLPSEIENLINLVSLHIDANELESLPIELSSLKKLKSFPFDENPFSKMPEIIDMGIVEIFNFLDKKRGINTHATVWKVPEKFCTAFKQYLDFFRDFVKTLTGKEFHFEVTSVKEGLKLTTRTTSDLTIEQINDYLAGFINQNLNISPNQEISKKQKFEIEQLKRDWEFEQFTLNHKIKEQFERLKFLHDSINDKNDLIHKLELRINFFEEYSMRFLELRNPKYNNTTIELTSNNIKPFDADDFLIKLKDKATRMAERKYTHSLEDLHNDLMTDWLRDYGYYITDQSRSGRSKISAGEVDLMVREMNDGTPISVVEAFRLKSCGEKNVIISSHIDKLLHDYDTIGHEVNYVIVYSETKDFYGLWENYFNYVEDLNNKKGFSEKYPLISFRDTKISNKTGLKIGIAKHQRQGQLVKVYHLVIDMFNDKSS